MKLVYVLVLTNVVVFCTIASDPLDDIKNLTKSVSGLVDQTKDLAEKAASAASSDIKNVTAKIALQTKGVAEKMAGKIDAITKTLEGEAKNIGDKLKGQSEALLKEAEDAVAPLEQLVTKAPQEFTDCEGAIEKSADMPALIAENEIARLALATAKSQLGDAQEATSETGKLSVTVADDTWELTRDIIQICKTNCADIKSMSAVMKLKPAGYDFTVNATVMGKEVTVDIDPSNVKAAAKKIFDAAKSDFT